MSADETTLAAEVAAWVGQRCGRPAEEIDRDRPLVEFGLSSVDAVELAGRLEQSLGRTLPATLLWEYPTINALVSGLVTPESAPPPQAPASAHAESVPKPSATVAPPGGENTEGAGRPDHVEQIAVIGIGCRFPGGANSLESLARVMHGDTDPVRPVPAGRWPELEPSSDLLARTGREAGFLDDVAGFDAEFFGILPSEAALMDPQQRILLEVAWEALAHAAVDPAGLAGSDTGVYVGISAGEYAHLTTADLSRVTGWTATGAALSIAANRLSYLLNLRGPSLAVDTACSSSLVGVNLAVRDLRAGTTDLALAAGVNLLLAPAMSVAFEQAGGLAENGRCRPFDAAADGIARGEGCGVVVLKRLSDARRDGDRVLAVVRGGAVNNDGRSNGLVAPNPQAQEALLRAAYADAGCDPGTVDYVQTHGTGTPLGDPIEAGALAAVCGAGRPAEAPLPIGSVKSHLGHLEAAAGIAGFITAVLALHTATVAPTRHFTRPNPHIPLQQWRLRVPSEPEPLTRPDRPARAGVSAFGFGGTNAHVVLEAAPEPEPETGSAAAERVVCVLSDHDLDRVRDQAAGLARWLGDRPDTSPRDVAGTVNRRGERGPARAALVAGDRGALRAGLAALGAGRPQPGVATGTGNAAAGPGVWVFSGYGAHWPAMGRRLLDTEPAFAAAVDELEPLFLAETGVSLRDGLREPADHRIAVAQPLTFGLQVALAALWRSYGLRPAAVLGHSMGEVAAAVVAGALTPADGVRVITHRSRLLAGLTPGAMAVVELAEEEFAELAAGLPQLWIAVHTAPGQLVVTGAPESVAAFGARVEQRGRLVRMVTSEGAGHSPAVDPILPALGQALAGLRAEPPRVPFYSTVSAEPRELDAEYWLANLRRPVRLADAVRAAAGDGFRFFLELSPHPVLVRPIGATLAAEAVTQPLLVASLRRDEPESFPAALATVYAHGHPAPPVPQARILDLPAPPWRGTTHWFDARTPAAPQLALPGEHAEVPGEERHVWRLSAPPGRLVRRTPGGAELLPLAGLVELALAAVASTGADEVVLTGVESDPAGYPAEAEPATTLARSDDGGWQVTVHAPGGDTGWSLLGRATAQPRSSTPPQPPDRTSDVEIDVPAGPDAISTCFGALADAMGGEAGPVEPGRADLVWAGADPSGGGSCRLWLADEPSGGARLRLLDHRGVVLLAVDGVRTHPQPQRDRPALLRGLFGVQWREQAIGSTAGAAVRVRLLAVPGDDLLAAALADPAAPADAEHADLAAASAAAEQAGLAAADAEEAGRGAGQPPRPGSSAADRDVVLIAPPAGPTPDPKAARQLALTAIRAAAHAGGRLWLVTRGAAAVRPDEPGRPDLAWVRGLVRTLAFEQPRTRTRWLDLDPGDDPAAQAAALWTELHAEAGEDEVAWRGRRRWSARLVRASLPQRRREPAVRRGAAYVITGGYHGIGLLVARWLAEAGAGRLILAGRSGPPADSVSELAAVRATGADVRIVLGDVAAAGVAEELVAAAGELPLAGVVHAAGVRHDLLLTHIGGEDLSRVWAPKVDGAWRLHSAVRAAGARLDWWLSMSSAAGLLGSPGQAAYATANAWLDAFAAWQRADGLPAWSIQWGTWSRIGGAIGVHLPGLDPVEPDEGMTALRGLLARRPGTVGVLHFDPGPALAAFPEAGRLPFFAAVTGAAQEAPAEWFGADRLRALPAAEAIRLIDERLGERIAAVLGADRPPPAAQPLTEAGLDSLAAVRVRSLIEADFARALPTSVLVGGVTRADLTRALAFELGLAVPETGEPVVSGPRDAAERAAVRLFEMVLGGERDLTARLAGPHDIARIVAAARQEYGVEVDPEALLADPSPEGLAGPLRAAEEAAVAAGGALRTLRTGQPTRLPLFLAHPAGGSTHVYRQLVDLLGEEQPVYGLERLDEAGAVPERAAHYVELIRARHPGGPYRIGGWSFGGALAFEAARQLTAAGEKVETVVLLDAGLPEPMPAAEAAELLVERYLGFARYLRDTYQAPVELDPQRLRELSGNEQFDLVLKTLEDSGLAERLPPAILRHQITSHQDTRALDEYRPGPYDGPVVLYRCTRPTPWAVRDRRYEHADAARGWDRYCTDLRIVPVAAHHLNLLDPPAVAAIAADLRRLL